MDYIVTDAITSPLRLHEHYSEKLAYMPHTYFISDLKQRLPHLRERLIITKKCANEHPSSTVLSNVAIINGIDLSPLIKCTDVKEISKERMSSEPVVMLRSIEVIEQPLIKPIEKMIENQQNQTTINNVVVYNGLKMAQYNKETAKHDKIIQHLVITTRQQYGLPENAIVYCNFNKLFKFDPRTFKLWIRVLKRVTNSVLWLVRSPADGESNLQNTAKLLGLPSGRIIFSDCASREEHVRRGQLADAYLDTYIYNGHTTSADMLWAGTPVVTLPGETFASRVAASLLNAIGCPELIADNRIEYEQIAIRLGTNRDYLHRMRQKIWNARNESPLFDCKQYTMGLENLFTRMWDRYSHGQPADHITDTIDHAINSTSTSMKQLKLTKQK